MKSRRSAPWLTIALSLLLAACERPSEAPATAGPEAANAAVAGPRLVLLYATCTVNKDHLAPYDPSVPYTPNLARFAERAVTFPAHHTEAGSSGIAFASLFTGTQADRHGVFRHPTRLSDDRLLIQEAFAQAGWDVFFWGGHAMANGAFNYAQGVPPDHVFAKTLVGPAPVFQALLDRLVAEPDYRVLVVTNFTLTHTPYATGGLAGFRREHPQQMADLTAADVQRFVGLYRKHSFPVSWNHERTIEKLGLDEDERARFAATVNALYESRVARLDRHFGRVHDAIAKRGLVGESVIAFLADHGEVLSRPDAVFQWSHSMQLAPEVISPPWLLAWPGSGSAPRRYDGVTRSIDVFPTLAGLAGVPLPASGGPDGVDLSPVLRGEEPAPDLPAFSHTTVLVRSVYNQMSQPEFAEGWSLVRQYFPDEDPEHVWAALRRGDRLYKLRRLDGETWRTEAFDLAADPVAENDIYDASDPTQRAHVEELVAYKARLVDAYRQQQASEGLLPAEREAEALKGLGYIQ